MKNQRPQNHCLPFMASQTDRAGQSAAIHFSSSCRLQRRAPPILTGRGMRPVDRFLYQVLLLKPHSVQASLASMSMLSAAVAFARMLGRNVPEYAEIVAETLAEVKEEIVSIREAVRG